MMIEQPTKSAQQSVETAFQGQRRRRLVLSAIGCVGVLAGLAVSAWDADATPEAVAAGLPRIGAFFAKLVPDLRWHALFGGTDTPGSVAYWMYRLDLWLWLLFQTSQMAALATAAGAGLGLLLSFPAAANLAPNRWVYQGVRRGLELCRIVPDLVYALILVWAFGIGPLAGILAIGLHTVGATGKLFAEAAENADMGPWEGLRAAGASWPQAVRYAILPQILPSVLSYTLLRFEINVRGATVIGFVGAGGIGQELYTVISFNYYQEIGAIVVLIIAAVSAIDLVSERLRRLVGAA